MPVPLLAKAVDSTRWSTMDSRAGRTVLLVVGAVSVVFGFVYHLLAMQAGAPPSVFLQVLYNVLVIVGYGAIGLLLAIRFQRRNATPARVFWTILFFGLIFIAVSSYVTSIGREVDEELLDLYEAEGEFDYYTGVPRVLLTVIKINVLSLLGSVFAFYVLLRIGSLVLFKRTKVSQRNWQLMLTLFLITAVTAFMKSPQSDPSIYQLVALVPAIGFMVVNSFRASWIVYMTFQEKLISIALSLVLLVLLFVGVGFTNFDNPLPFLADMRVYMLYYNYVLYLFVMLVFGFGVMYCTASLLLLLFHLPTTGDFQRRTHERVVMQSLTNLVTQAFDPEKLYSSVASSPVEAGTADTGWLALADPKTGSLHPEIAASYNITPQRVTRLMDVDALYSELSATRTSLYLEQASTDHRLNVRPGDGFSSLLAVPLMAREEMLGALFVTKEVAHGFEKDDIESIHMFAAQAALALDNARLFREQVEKERLARELDIAREVQRKLLPQRLPLYRGLSLCASNVSAERVGGDFYDFFELDEHRLCVIIGDVSGKGTSAAFFMAVMQGIFQSVSRLAPRPVDFLRHANAALGHTLDKNVFISLIYGILDTQREEFVMARAGHNPMATINLHGDTRLVRPDGIGLGLDRSGVFEKSLEEITIPLKPGDAFVLYTDGVVESRNMQGDEYGYERLLEAMRRHRAEEAAGIHDALLTDLQTFIGSKAYDDDMTLVVMKWHGIDLPTAGDAAQSRPASLKPA
ncbi:MAG: GAF domain-containing SpoIIE family protein phosphatase [Rhodothermales bacterium]